MGKSQQDLVTFALMLITSHLPHTLPLNFDALPTSLWQFFYSLGRIMFQIHSLDLCVNALVVYFADFGAHGL